MQDTPRPEEEASLGEAQSSDPPLDPEMIDESAEQGEGGETDPQPYQGSGDEAGDQDAEGTLTPEQVERDSERDQAEG